MSANNHKKKKAGLSFLVFGLASVFCFNLFSHENSKRVSVIAFTTSSQSKWRKFFAPMPDVILYPDGTLLKSYNENGKTLSLNNYSKVSLKKKKMSREKVCQLYQSLGVENDISYKLYDSKNYHGWKLVYNLGEAYSDKKKAKKIGNNKIISLYEQLINISFEQSDDYIANDVVLGLVARPSAVDKNNTAPKWPFTAVINLESGFKTSNLGYKYFIIHGELARKVTVFFHDHVSVNVNQNKHDFTVFQRPLLPHQAINEQNLQLEYKSDLTFDDVCK